MLACSSAAPCNGNFAESHLLTLHRCSGLLLQYRLLPLSAANPGRSSKAEAETHLQNTLSAPFADPWQAPPEQAPAPAPSKAGGEVFSKHCLCPVFFLVQLPLASTGTNLIGVWQFAVAVADSHHTTLARKSGGEQCSTNTPLCPEPKRICASPRGWLFLLASEHRKPCRAAHSSRHPGAGYKKNIIQHSGVQMKCCSLYLYFKKRMIWVMTALQLSLRLGMNLQTLSALQGERSLELSTCCTTRQRP